MTTVDASLGSEAVSVGITPLLTVGHMIFAMVTVSETLNYAVLAVGSGSSSSGSSCSGSSSSRRSSSSGSSCSGISCSGQ